MAEQTKCNNIQKQNVQYNAQNNEKDTPENEYLKRKDVCNGLSICHFMKRLCCYELLRNLYYRTNMQEILDIQ